MARLDWSKNPTKCLKGHDLTLPNAIAVYNDNYKRCRMCETIGKRLSVANRRKNGYVPVKRKEKPVNAKKEFERTLKILALAKELETETRQWIRLELKQKLKELGHG